MLTGRRLYRRSKQGLPCKLPERQVANLSFSLAFEAVLSDQQYLVDGETGTLRLTSKTPGMELPARTLS
jgi:hypothetical protein